MSEWEKIKKHLEPVALNFFTSVNGDISMSQAISLKRIADALEKLTVIPKMVELTPEQEEEWSKAMQDAGYITYSKKEQ